MDAKHTGLIIRESRKQLGMTQKDLAEKLHVTEAAVSKWENGKGFPDIVMIEPLADCLGISVENLLKGEEDASKEQHEGIVKELIHISSEAQKKDRRKIKVFQYLFAGAMILSVIAACVILPRVTVSKGDIYEQMFDRVGISIQLPKGWTAERTVTDFKARSANGESTFWIETAANRLHLPDLIQYGADDDETWYRTFEVLVSTESEVNGDMVLSDTVSVTRGKVDHVRSSSVNREYVSSYNRQVFVREETMILCRGEKIVFISVYPKNDESAAKETDYIRNHLKVTEYEIMEDFKGVMTPVLTQDHHAEYKIQSDMDTVLIWRTHYRENGSEDDIVEYVPVLMEAGREYTVTIDVNGEKNVYVIQTRDVTFYSIYNSRSYSWFDVRTMKTVWLEDEIGINKHTKVTVAQFFGENNNEGAITLEVKAVPHRQVIKR